MLEACEYLDKMLHGGCLSSKTDRVDGADICTVVELHDSRDSVLNYMSEISFEV